MAATKPDHGVSAAIRWPREMLRQIDRVARETGCKRSTAVKMLVNQALAARARFLVGGRSR